MEMAEGYSVESVSASSDEDVPGTSTRKGGIQELTESKSGIGWKFANQGTKVPSPDREAC